MADGIILGFTFPRLVIAQAKAQQVLVMRRLEGWVLMGLTVSTPTFGDRNAQQ